MPTESISIAERAPVEGSRTGIHHWLVDKKVAFATLKPSEMKNLLFVSTYSSTDPHSPAPQQHGYQRDPMDVRFPQIGRYHYGHHNLITPLAISVRLTDSNEVGEF